MSPPTISPFLFLLFLLLLLSTGMRASSRAYTPTNAY